MMDGSHFEILFEILAGVIIRFSWHHIAGNAYVDYLIGSPCYVRIHLSDIAKAHSPIMIPIVICFYEHEPLVGPDGLPDEELAKAIRDYDPDKEVIVVLAASDGNYSILRIRDTPEPHQLYRHPDHPSSNPRNN